MDSNIERCLLIVKEVELFCKLYQMWPMSQKVMSEKINEKAKNLHNKLISIGYIGTSDFAFYTLRTNDGELVIDVLDRLYEKYYKSKNDNKEYLTRKSLDLVRYCNQYHRWPECNANPITAQEIMANRCRKWLDSAHYIPFDTSSFIYKRVRDASGRFISDVFDKLYQNMQVWLAPEEVLTSVDEIIFYCEEYHEWPRQVMGAHNDKEVLSNKLTCWLNFNYKIYNSALYLPDFSVKDILERYYFTYSDNSVGNSEDESLFLYREIIRKSHYMFISYEAYMEFQKIVLEEIRKRNLSIDFNTIAEDIALPIEERIKSYYCKYKYFSESGNTYLAMLYYNLYMYFVIHDKVSFHGEARKRKK